MVSAGQNRSVLLRSDGCAVACGAKVFFQCNTPPLDQGVTYTQVSAGNNFTVLLRSDGHADAVGTNSYGQCDISPLDDGAGKSLRNLRKLANTCEISSSAKACESAFAQNAACKSQNASGESVAKGNCERRVR